MIDSSYVLRNVRREPFPLQLSLKKDVGVACLPGFYSLLIIGPSTLLDCLLAVPGAARDDSASLLGSKVRN